jgi:hypothetical protein
MKKKIAQVLLVITLVTASEKVFAWGKTGHEIVAQIAFHFLDDSTKNLIQEYLGNLSIEEAANWMDDSKGNTYYNYMRTWHYLDMEKGEKYTGSSERNILTVLHSAITELRTYKTIKKKDVKRDLLLLFHLIGDLHQPLHCGLQKKKGTIRLGFFYLFSNIIHGYTSVAFIVNATTIFYKKYLGGFMRYIKICGNFC